MEDKNELSDIVLEKDDGNKTQKFKRLLMGAAVLVLLFLAVLIVMRTVNKPDTPKNDSRLVLPPEPSAKVEKPVEPKDDQLFKQVPIIEEESKKESFEDMVKKLKAKEIKRTEVEEKVVEPIKEKVQEVTKIEPEKIEAKKEEPKKIEDKVQDVKQAFEEAAKKLEEAPKKVITPKPVATPKIDANNGTKATKGTYVQVGATSKKTPDAKYLKSLTNKSYPYRLHKVTIKGKEYIKILIGPYDGRNAAKEALPTIQKDVNPKAFIFRVP